jgi:hypothetical protein
MPIASGVLVTAFRQTVKYRFHTTAILLFYAEIFYKLHFLLRQKISDASIGHSAQVCPAAMFVLILYQEIKKCRASEAFSSIIFIPSLNEISELVQSYYEGRRTFVHNDAMNLHFLMKRGIRIK